MKHVGHDELRAAREAYRQGQNVTELLKQLLGAEYNSDEIVQLAYDLQAGSYSEYAVTEQAYMATYARELASIVDAYVPSCSVMLDVGTGELTTLSFLSRELRLQIERWLACDISWSRLRHGLEFARSWMLPQAREGLEVFVSDMAQLPLASKSVDVVVSSHALEPNGGREEELLGELFRVATDKVILFEPSYEDNSTEGQERMRRLGYVRGLQEHAERLGATCVGKHRIVSSAVPLNPTYAFVFSPPPAEVVRSVAEYAVPGAPENALVRRTDCFASVELGLSYPMIQRIPILRSEAAILTTALGGFLDEQA